MSLATPTYDAVRLIAQKMVELIGQPTPDAIREKVALALSVADPNGELDPEALARDLESRFSMVIGDASIMDDSGEEHIPWLADRRSDVAWSFWNRYREYLETNEGLAPAIVARIDQLSDDILERLEYPGRPGVWDRRGLVAGHVQSGKTANYTALICKSIDAGYKLVVVLTGMHNSLRSQTQLRLDEAVLGIDTSRSPAFQINDDQTFRIGVGLPPYPTLIANSLTTSADGGDFRRKVADNAGIIPGGDPLVLIVKKHTSVLKNLHDWAKAVRGQRDHTTGNVSVKGVPLLLIDDEADVASINTKDVPVNEDGSTPDDYDVTKMNAAIRRILKLFDQSAYVAYTATPFANVFIHPDHETAQLGADLFPRNFIISLPAPSNYIGPAQVFGIGDDPRGGVDNPQGMNIVRYVEDQDSWLPVNHKKDFTPGPLPDSLTEAIRVFVVACAARTARGQEKWHKSMLVHVTRYTNVQEQVAEMISAELKRIRERLEIGDGASPDNLRDSLREIWRRDFEPTSETLGGLAGERVSWRQVEEHLVREASKIQVRTINGTAKDVLDYKENARIGLNVVAIGGDKLSRGLTLEGLTVSYYLRASKMYDTLMQMGRWFGYRPGYADLCRLYTTFELAEWYRHITLASEELRQQFDVMAAAGETPERFGLKVRTHPDGLMVTAANKLRNGRVVKLSYSADVSETILFESDPVVLKKNFRAVESLVSDMLKQAQPQSITSNRELYRWDVVPGDRIADFFDDFKTHPGATKARADLISKYIRAQLRQDEPELIEWTVALISKSEAEPDKRRKILNLDVGLTTRAPYPEKDSRHLEGRAEGDPERYVRFPDHLRIRQLRSPRDEQLDLTPEQVEEARRLTYEVLLTNARDAAARRAQLAAPGVDAEPAKGVREPKEPSGQAIRRVRGKHRGLLLIYLLHHLHADPQQPPPVGLVVSFPASDTAREVDYQVNNVYWATEFGE